MPSRSEARAAWTLCGLGGVLSRANGQVHGQSISLTHRFGDCPRKVGAHSSGVAALVFPKQFGQGETVCDFEPLTLADVERMAGLSQLPTVQ